MAAAFIAGGVLYHRHYQNALRADAERMLLSIEQLKLNQLQLWREDRANTVLSLMDGQPLRAYLNAFAAEPAGNKAAAVLRARLGVFISRNSYQFAALAGLDGKVLLHTGGKPEKMCPEVTALIARAKASGRPEMGDFYLHPGEASPHIDIVTPAVRGPRGREIFLLLRVDPSDFLYPLLQTWSGSGDTGEILLVGREGDELVYLNDLRHVSNAAMRLRRPLDMRDLPAAMGLRGITGIVEGRDYRGVPVLAAVSPVPGTSWAIVTKMDLEEALKGSGTLGVVLALLVLALLAAAGAGAYLLLMRQAAAYERIRVNYDLFSERANDGMLVVDMATRTVLEANRRACEMYGYPPERMKGLKAEAVIPPGDREVFRQRIAETVRAGGSVYEVSHLRADGTAFPAEISATIVDVAGKTTMFVIVRDISERRRAEEKLRNSNERFTLAARAAGLGVWDWNVETNSLNWDDRMFELYGVKRENFPGAYEAWLKGVHPEDRARCERESELALKGEKAYDTEFRVLLPDGTVRHLKAVADVFRDPAGRPTRMVGVNTDITKRKKSRELLERLTDQVPGVLYQYRLYPDGRSCFPYSSSGMELIYEVTSEEVREDATPVFGRLHPDDMKATSEAISVSARDLSIFHWEFRVVLPKQGLRWRLCDARPERLPDGGTLWHGIIIDITDRKLAEEALRKSEKDLREAQRLARIGNWTLDLSANRLEWSEEIFRIFEVNPSRFGASYEAFLEVIHPEDRDSVNKAYTESLKNRTPYEIVHRLLMPDGRIKYVSEFCETFYDAEGRPQRSVGTVQDITDRRLAEQELQALSQQRELALSAARLGWWTYDPVSKIASYDRRYKEIFEVTGSSQPNEEILKRLHPEDLPGVWAKVEAALDPADPRPYSAEYRVVIPGGALKWVEARGLAIFEGEGKARRAVNFVGTVADITERRNAEEALRKSETAVRSKLQALLSPEGELETLELGDILDVAELQAIMDEFYALTKIGIGIIDMKGKVLVGTGWQEICTRFHRVNAETARNCVESDTVLSDGVERGKCKSYLCKNNLRDIATPIIVAGKHLGNLFLGQFLYTDEPYAPEVFRQQARRYGFDEKAYMAAYEKLPRFSREQVDTVMRFYARFSELISTLSYGKIKLARALAQSRQAELEKEHLNKALAAKNKEMENFLYITTHDLRSPLVNIQGFSQNLQRYLGEIAEALEAAGLPQERKEQARELTGEKVPEALGFVLESSAKMDALLSALLKVSRLGRQELKPERVEMGPLLKRIVDTMLFQVRQAGAEVKIGALPPCRADAASVSQLFSNLLDNAVKYRDAGRGLVVEIGGETRGGMAVYRVADNGPGIPAADLERLWDVFYKPGRAGKKGGEGIGLPMCRRIAERNGGGISVEPAPGGGSVFVVELPAA